MKQLFQFTTVLVTLLTFNACSSLAQLDREYLNQPSMDLSKYEAAKNIAPLSQLTGVGTGGAAAGCSVCAH